MAVLGHILGIAILILGILLVAGLIRYAVKFDFDAPLFKTDITFSDNTEDKR